MAPAATYPKQNDWSVEFDTLKREKLFKNPPKGPSAYSKLSETIRPHIDSFNNIFERCKHLQAGVEDIGIRTFLTENPARQEGRAKTKKRDRLHVRIAEVYLEKPQLPPSNKFSASKREIYPAECRERHATYRARLLAKLQFRVNEGDWKDLIRELGSLPIMLRSNRCHLERSSPAELMQHKEETEELGGYFIVNGNERLIRMLIMPRRNFPMAIERSSYMNRGHSYTKFGIQIRCVRPDQSSQTNVLHYLNDGNVTFRFSWKKNEYLVPVMMILKALVETNDREIFEKLVGGARSEGAKNTFVTDRVELLLRTYKAYNLHGKQSTRAYLGEKFKPVLDVPADTSNYDAGVEFLRRVVLVHLGNVNVTEAQDRDKFSALLFMMRKLYALVAGDCAVDNPDAMSNQEVLLGGQLYGMIIKERLEDWLASIRPALRYWAEQTTPHRGLNDPDFAKDFAAKILRRTSNDIGGALEYFLSTGNLSSRSGLDLQQISGFTVVAEKINFYRFISHFRMVHRGSFFQQLKTTTVRKLLPESWGFLCPVHTPDGSPCGLLNHLAHECRIMTRAVDVSKVPEALTSLGVSDYSSCSTEESVAVLLDGRVMGYCSPKQARIITDTLRHWKVEGGHNLPLELEVGHVPISNGGMYPGVYLFSEPSRMIRPVTYLPLNKKDMVGPFEQQFMSIAVGDHEIESGESTHVEIDPRNILSILANQTPFSDHNQSPRNMYQCQMSKQAMGTPGTSIRFRTDNKSYRLQTGQTPIVRPPLYNAYGLDNFPNGMNAVVAVISYTGYDMDDAMILNKSAHERGFGHGTMYKTKVIHLDEDNKRSKSKVGVKKLFGFAPGGPVPKHTRAILDEDGLPYVGALMTEGSPLCAYHTVSWDAVSNSFVNRDGVTEYTKYKESEAAFIEEVRVLGTPTGEDTPCQAVSIKLRLPRSPVIGDKFSSRHGQKGVCSQKWPTVDMPFSESGIVPDVIINPHAFPSRMTIGMFVESLAGKAGALHGLAQDSSPWRFDERAPAAAFFGEQLRAAGYNYHGNEPMYSGITGGEFAADIYLGVVFYQRLRHMVDDKFQVRTTGPVTATTGQPIKGRQRGGGIRVGEMERDALLAHGAAYLLQDRLLNCSDYTRAWLCRACGSFLSVQPAVSRAPGAARAGASATAGAGSGPPPVVRCRRCAQKVGEQAGRGADVWEDGEGTRFVGGEDTTVVAIPGVLRYLDVELAAMGVKLKFDVEP